LRPSEVAGLKVIIPACLCWATVAERLGWKDYGLSFVQGVEIVQTRGLNLADFFVVGGETCAVLDSARMPGCGPRFAGFLFDFKHINHFVPQMAAWKRLLLVSFAAGCGFGLTLALIGAGFWFWE
jgi:hypothetical protein